VIDTAPYTTGVPAAVHWLVVAGRAIIGIHATEGEARKAAEAACINADDYVNLYQYRGTTRATKVAQWTDEHQGDC
jgi:hypothetical protein